MFFVLIDTWWNVNLTSTGYVRRDVRSFNRYMVECELITKTLSTLKNGTVLIDTWWNVNFKLIS